MRKLWLRGIRIYQDNIKIGKKHERDNKERSEEKDIRKI